PVRQSRPASVSSRAKARMASGRVPGDRPGSRSLHRRPRPIVWWSSRADTRATRVWTSACARGSIAAPKSRHTHTTSDRRARGEDVMADKNILHMVTPLKHMSPFDVNMAVDAGYDAVIPYTNVTLDEITGLVQDAIFSRPPKIGARTAMFIAGKNAIAALDMMEKAKK